MDNISLVKKHYDAVEKLPLKAEREALDYYIETGREILEVLLMTIYRNTIEKEEKIMNEALEKPMGENPFEALSETISKLINLVTATRYFEDMADRLAKVWLIKYTKPATAEDYIKFLKKAYNKITHHYDYDMPKSFYVVVKQPVIPMFPTFRIPPYNLIIHNPDIRIEQPNGDIIKGIGDCNVYFSYSGEHWGDWVPCFNNTVF